MTKRILCFGDSLTWGWVAVPEGSPTTRFPYAERWTGAMAAKLGPDYEIIEEGLSARTTSLDDPADSRLNGSAYLPSAIASHLPLDLVIIMLGTNDTKSYFRRTPYEIAVGMSKLAGQVLTSGGGVGTIYPAPKVLIVAPPPLADLSDPWLQGMFEGGREKTIDLANQYRSLAAFLKVDFFDAGSVISTDGVDGIHVTAKNNADLGAALAGKVTNIFLPLGSPSGC
jgi:lysophospholipase L1-like esterase